MSINVQPINLGAALTQGIRRDVEDTWETSAPVYEELNKTKARKLEDKGLRSNKFAFYGSHGRPEIWEPGQARNHDGFDDFILELSMTPFEHTIDVNTRDRKHSQLSDPKNYAISATHRYLQIPQRQMRDYQEGTTDATLGDLKKAWDGGSMYSSTDGSGGQRHGVAEGNILTGFVRTEAGFYQTLLRAQELFLAYKDTRKEDLIFGEGDVAFTNFHIEVPRTMMGLVQQVADVSLLKLSLGNNTSEGNLFTSNSKYKFTFNVNNELTNQSNFFIHLKHPRWQPFVMIQEQNINTIWADAYNSDRSREFNIESLYSDQESGCAPYATWSTMKVTP